MKEIPKEFKKHGDDFKLLFRRGRLALYKRDDGMGTNSYEVHKVRISSTPAQFGVKGASRTKCERLASDNDFGTFGWGFQEIQPAIDKFKELEAK